MKLVLMRFPPRHMEHEMSKSIDDAHASISLLLMFCMFALSGCGRPKHDPLTGRLNDTEYVRERLAMGTTWKDGVDYPIDKDALILTALQMGSRVETIELLLKAGANPNARGSLQKTLLFFAAWNGTVDVADALIAAGADVNATDLSDNNALREAIVGQHPKLVERLLDAGTSPVQLNDDGESMADLAHEFGSDEIKGLFLAALEKSD